MGQITEKKFKKDKMNKLIKLRKFIKIYKLDGYLVPKNDEYFNEYVSQSNDRLKFISNFSGSAGFAIILKKKIICLLMEDTQYKPKFSQERISQLLQYLRNFLRMY